MLAHSVATGVYRVAGEEQWRNCIIFNDGGKILDIQTVQFLRSDLQIDWEPSKIDGNITISLTDNSVTLTNS